MAHLLRLIAAALLLLAGQAHALVPTTAGWYVSFSGGPGGIQAAKDATTSGDKQSSCDAFAEYLRPVQPPVYSYPKAVVQAGSPGSCRAEFWNSTYDYRNSNIVGQFVAVGICPANSNMVNATQCQCNTGYHEEGGACVVNPPDCTPGEVYSEPSTKDYGPSGDPFGPADFKADLLTRAPSCAGQCALQVTGGGLPIVGRQFNGRWFIDRAGLSKSGGNCTQTGKDIEDGLKWDQLGDAQNAPPNPCPPARALAR